VRFSPTLSREAGGREPPLVGADQQARGPWSCSRPRRCRRRPFPRCPRTFASASLLSSLARWERPRVQAKIEAIELVEVLLALLVLAVNAGSRLPWAALGLDGLAVRGHQPPRSSGRASHRPCAHRVGLHVGRHSSLQAQTIAAPTTSSRAAHHVRRSGPVLNKVIFLASNCGLNSLSKISWEDVLEAAVHRPSGSCSWSRDRPSSFSSGPMLKEARGEIGDRGRRDCTSPARCPALGDL